LVARLMPNTANASAQRRAIERLARETELPIDEVAALYELERRALDETAKVKRFLPIFALRSVREQLLKRHP
jgi:hypothetical protein